MKHLRVYNEDMTYRDFKSILQNTPIKLPVFVLTEDWIEYYTEEEHLIKKGTEVFVPDIESIGEVRTLCPLNFYTEVEESVMQFVEYRDKKEIDKQLDMYSQSKKYNI